MLFYIILYCATCILYCAVQNNVYNTIYIILYFTVLHLYTIVHKIFTYLTPRYWLRWAKIKLWKKTQQTRLIMIVKKFFICHKLWEKKNHWQCEIFKNKITIMPFISHLRNWETWPPNDLYSICKGPQQQKKCSKMTFKGTKKKHPSGSSFIQGQTYSACKFISICQVSKL
jgi:hypothetical protein